LKGEVREAVDAESPLHEQTAAFAHVLQELGCPFLPLTHRGQRFGNDLLRPGPLHLAQALLVHAVGQRLQHAAFARPIELPRDALGLVPVTEQDLGALVVQFHPPVGQRGAVAMDHGDDGQQQRIDRQAAHAVVGPDSSDEFPGFPLRPAAGDRFGHLAFHSPGSQLHRQAPVASKALHVFVAEIADLQLGAAGQGHCTIPRRPGGDDETVAAVGAYKVLDLLGHPEAFFLGRHFVHAIQQHDAAAVFQSFLEETLRALPGQFRRGTQGWQVLGRQGKAGARQFAQRDEDGQPLFIQSQRFPGLPAGELEGQITQQGGLARARPTQDDQPLGAAPQGFPNGQPFRFFTAQPWTTPWPRAHALGQPSFRHGFDHVPGFQPLLRRPAERQGDVYLLQCHRHRRVGADAPYRQETVFLAQPFQIAPLKPGSRKASAQAGACLLP
jgi:hypothetical protein